MNVTRRKSKQSFLAAGPNSGPAHLKEGEKGVLGNRMRCGYLCRDGEGRKDTAGEFERKPRKDGFGERLAGAWLVASFHPKIPKAPFIVGPLWPNGVSTSPFVRFVVLDFSTNSSRKSKIHLRTRW